MINVNNGYIGNTIVENSIIEYIPKHVKSFYKDDMEIFIIKLISTLPQNRYELYNMNKNEFIERNICHKEILDVIGEDFNDSECLYREQNNYGIYSYSSCNTEDALMLFHKNVDIYKKIMSIKFVCYSSPIYYKIKSENEITEDGVYIVSRGIYDEIKHPSRKEAFSYLPSKTQIDKDAAKHYFCQGKNVWVAPSLNEEHYYQIMSKEEFNNYNSGIRFFISDDSHVHDHYQSRKNYKMDEKTQKECNDYEYLKNMKDMYKFMHGC